jgi:hypothetical protein
MKDVTVTSFGLVIAYLLPGLSLLYTLGFWFPEIHSLFQAFLTTASNFGLFVIVVLVSLIAGLIVHGIRAVFYEYVFCKKENRFQHAQFKKFTSTGRAEAFRSLVDEMFRYHQWWGALSIIWPLFAYGFLSNGNGIVIGTASFWPAIGVVAVLEIVFAYIAQRVLNDYFGRFNKMLEGESDVAIGAAPSAACPATPEVQPRTAPDRLNKPMK